MKGLGFCKVIYCSNFWVFRVCRDLSYSQHLHSKGIGFLMTYLPSLWEMHVLKRPEEGTIFLVKARRNNPSGVSYSEALPHLVVTTRVPFRPQIQLASPKEYCTGKSPQVCPSLPASSQLKYVKASNPKSIKTAPTISDV